MTIDAPYVHPVLWRSAAFRLATLQAAIFALIVVTLFSVTWWSVGAYVEQRVHSNAMDALRQLNYWLQPAHGGAVRLGELDLNSDQHFGVFDGAGSHLDGEIQVLAKEEQDLQLLRKPGQRPMWLHVVTGQLEDGRQLVAGIDRLRADALLERLRNAFLMAGLAGVLVALVAGFVTARNYLRRVEHIAAVAAQIADGKLDRRLAVGSQQDEIDRLSAALNATWQHSESLVESMRLLSIKVAHELRTPLSHLLFRLEQARSLVGSPQQARLAIDRSVQDVEHVLAVFGALLRITQIQSRQRRAGFETVDLSQLVATVVADYRPLFEDETRPLQADIQSGIEIIGDRMLLQQQLVNLIENALRHTPRDTALSVQLKAVADRAELRVADSGPGIPEGQRELVLQRLVRLETAHATPGTGLGLSLVKAIAELHEASLQLIDARPGLCVFMRFPLPSA